MAGENVNFTYRFGKGVYNQNAVCTGVAYGIQVIATESHARQYRAMYPHQRGPGKFGISMAINGYANYYAVMEFFRGYVRSMMDASDTQHSPGMNVNVVGDDGFHFFRVGVPLGPFPDGDHVGSMLFTPTIMFEMISDPLDTTAVNETTGGGLFSYFTYGDNYEGGGADDTTRFFYPVSAGSQNPNTRAEDVFDYGQAGGQPLPPKTPGVSAPGFGSPELLGN